MASKYKKLVNITPFIDTALKDIKEKTGESTNSFIRQAIREKLEACGYLVKKARKS